MTTLETLTVFQVHALQIEAELAGDTDTARDCMTVDAAYWMGPGDDLQGALESNDVARAAAERIVSVIRNAEGQQRGGSAVNYFADQAAFYRAQARMSQDGGLRDYCLEKAARYERDGARYAKGEPLQETLVTFADLSQG